MISNVTGHTPGPWRLRPYVGHKAECNDWPGRIEAADGTTVYAGPFAFRSLRGRTPEEAEANARLMAAAPALLVAFKRLTNLLRSLRQRLADTGPEEDWEKVLDRAVMDIDEVLEAAG